MKSNSWNLTFHQSRKGIKIFKHNPRTWVSETFMLAILSEFIIFQYQYLLVIQEPLTPSHKENSSRQFWFQTPSNKNNTISFLFTAAHTVPRIPSYEKCHIVTSVQNIHRSRKRGVTVAQFVELRNESTYPK